MVKINLSEVFLILCILCVEIRASTHWVVTEKGRIQAQPDSPFHLRRPYDVITLLEQENRRTNITALYNEMHKRKNMIDKKWSGIEGATEVESRIYKHDSYCVQVGKQLADVDLYTSVAANGSDRIEIQFGNVDDVPSENYIIPDCTNYISVTYSMCAFEHLDAMAKRSELQIPQEVTLVNLLPVASVDAFGHGVSMELQRNKTSWTHYNLAVLYWRIKGNAYNAIECGRRALHFVPRQYRDIPLLTLADVLHQSLQPKDAAVLLQSAIRHSPEAYLNYVVLGNTYAVQYDYNRSIHCYDIVLNNTDFNFVGVSKAALLCHKSLDEGLMLLHGYLQTILTELHDYHTLQQQWLRLQERLIWEQAPIKLQSFGGASEKHSTGQRCVQRTSYDDKQPTITCDFTDHDSAAQFEADVTLNFQKLLQNVESETKKISEQIERSRNRHAAPATKKSTTNKIDKVVPKANLDKAPVGDLEDNMPPLIQPTYPLTLSPSRNLYFDTAGWPTRAECTLWNLPLKEHDDLDIPVFLPPENKGYQVTKMLTAHIGLPLGKEHGLPWHPPHCHNEPGDVEHFYLPAKLRQITNGAVLKSHPLMKEHFLNYIKSGKSEESEIGQRIVTAIKKRAGPEWVLATLASLYWRLRSNSKNALHCLDLAFQSVPKGSTDVILVSIGSVLYQLGLMNEATKYAKLAFKVNFYEPSTNFLLAILHYRSNNPILAMYYMKNVLRIEPDYYDGKANELLRTWSCRIKMGAYEDLKIKASKDGSGCFSGNDQCNKPDNCHQNEKVSQAQGEQCYGKPQISMSQATWSNLVPNEVLRSSLADLESSDIGENPRMFHMKVTLANGAIALGDFYISASLTSDTVPESVINVRDVSGRYTLSTRICSELNKIDWYSFDIKWQSNAKRNINIKHLLEPLPPELLKGDLKPECVEPLRPSLILDRMANVLNSDLPDVPEEALAGWLGIICGDTTATVSELGTKMCLALQKDPKSWKLPIAAAFYWRIIGDNNRALKCLKQALAYVPHDMKDIPLISLSNTFQRVEMYSEALEVAYLAAEINPKYVINHYILGTIYDTMGSLDKGLSYYRSSLVLDATFLPAQTRIKELLCSLLFDEYGVMKDMSKFE